MDQPTVPREAIVVVADRIEARLGHLTDEIATTVSRDIPFYRQAPAEMVTAFAAVAAAEIGRVLDGMRSSSRLLPLRVREAYRRQGERFAEEGIPLSDLTRTFEVTTRVLVPAVIDEAMALGSAGVEALESYLRVVLDQLTTAVSLVSRAYVDRANEMRSERRDLRAQLLTDLLAGGNPEALAARASGAGLPRTESYAVLVAPLPVRDDQVLQIEIERSFAQMANAWWVPLGHLIAVVVPVPPKATERIRDAAESVLDAIGGVVSAPVVALGPARPGLVGIRRSFHEAKDIADAAAAAGLSGVVRERDVAIHRLLSAAPDVASELRELLSPLEEHDPTAGNVLIATLTTFLDCDLSTVEAARVLGVHRNTLRYRLDMINGLLGRDIADLRLLLKLALISRDMQRGRAEDE